VIETLKETAKFLGHGLCASLSKSTTTTHPIVDVRAIHREVKNLYEKMNVEFVELRGMGIQLSKLEKTAPVNPTLNRFLQQQSKKSDIPAKPVVADRPTRGRPRKGTKTQPKNSLSNFFKSKKDSLSQSKVCETSR
jgi:DNA repair protein REV1